MTRDERVRAAAESYWGTRDIADVLLEDMELALEASGYPAEVARLRHDLNRALDALRDARQVCARGTACGAIMDAALDRETPGRRMSELRSEVLDHFRSTAGVDHDREAQCGHPDEALSPSHMPGGWCNACGAFRPVRGVATYLGDVRPLAAQNARLHAENERLRIEVEGLRRGPQRALLADHDREAQP